MLFVPPQRTSGSSRRAKGDLGPLDITKVPRGLAARLIAPEAFTLVRAIFQFAFAVFGFAIAFLKWTAAFCWRGDDEKWEFICHDGGSR